MKVWFYKQNKGCPSVSTILQNILNLWQKIIRHTKGQGKRNSEETKQWSKPDLDETDVNAIKQLALSGICRTF